MRLSSSRAIWRAATAIASAPSRTRSVAFTEQVHYFNVASTAARDGDDTPLDVPGQPSPAPPIARARPPRMMQR